MLGKTNISNRIIWILLAFFGWYILMGEIFMIMFEKLIRAVFKDPSAGLLFVNEFYAPLFASCLFFVVMCLLVKKNRFMIGIVRPTRDGRSMKMLGFGILLGFLTNLCTASRGHQALPWFLRGGDTSDDIRVHMRVFSEHFGGALVQDLHV